ncbi:MAG: TrkA family potassium uptake protein [bacterium]|nr:TrkA family potassium uptake protein [bacterium]
MTTDNIEKPPRIFERPHQFVVIGLGNFGLSVARTLVEAGYEVLAIDADPQRIQNVVDEKMVTHAVVADVTNQNSLKDAGVDSSYDCGVLSISSDLAASIIATLLLKQLGVNQVIAKAADKVHGQVLQMIGADKIVYPEEELGERIARSLMSGYTLDYLGLPGDFSILEMYPPEKFIGKTLSELNLRAEFETNIIAVKEGEKVFLPHAETKVSENMTLIVIIHNDMREKLLGI